MKEKIKSIVGIIIAILLIICIGIFINNYIHSKTDEVSHPVATFEIQDYGTVKFELYPEYAPNTVSNIIALIEKGYYNNKIVYGKDDVSLYLGRTDKKEETEENAENTEETAENNENAEEPKTEENSEEKNDEYDKPMASLIDDSIEKDSEDDYEYSIDGEFVANKFEKNTLRHEKGVLSLNRSDYSSYGLTDESYNSGSSQFSVLMQDSANLNGVYCGFGRVTEGLDILEKIYNEVEIKKAEDENAEASSQESIQEFDKKPVITNATVEKNGVDYGKPDIHKAFDIQSYLNELYSSYYSN